MTSLKQLLLVGAVIVAGVLAGNSANAENTVQHGKCQIMITKPCLGNKSVPVKTVVEENFKGANGSPAICLKRAKEYYATCANPDPTFIAYSIFSVDGVTVISAATSKSAMSVYSPTSSNSNTIGLIALGK